MGGYSFKIDSLFYTFFKKHKCPDCGNKLLRKTVSEVVSSNSPEVKKYDFEVTDITVKGNITFAHIELFCNQSNKYYTVKEAKENNF